MFKRTIRTPEGSYKFSWSEILLVIAVFTKELGSRNDFGVDFDYLGYPFFILYFVIFFAKILRENAAPMSLYFYLILSSLFSILLLNLPMGGFFKQIIPIIVLLSVSFTILKRSNLNFVFFLYVKLAFWTAVFGIIQVLLSLEGINILINIPGTLDSIAYEPSHYASLLMPALVYTFLNYKRFKLYFIVMTVALFLTFNLTGYLVFLGILTFSTFHPLYVLVSIPIAYYLFFNVLPTFSKNFSVRFFDTFQTLSGENDILVANLKVNGTTFSFFSNFEVAKYTLQKNPITGSGLGGHEEMYYRRYEGTTFRMNVYYGLNAKSAHSLSLRVLSELGILGFILYIFTLGKSLIVSKKGLNYAISLACISHFLCKSFKLGGFIDYGTPFFFTMLLLNAKASKIFSQQTPKDAEKKNNPVPVHQIT